MIVVYTCILGNYDPLRPVNPGCRARHICFTDDPSLEAEGWDIIKISPLFPDDPIRSSRFPKIMPHVFLECSESIWIDGSCKVSGDICSESRKATFDLGLIRHPTRCCLYQEAERVIRSGLDRREVVEKQIQRYRESGFKEGMGLFRGGFIYRRHTEEIRKFNEAWWKEYLDGSRRDQISLNYIRRQMNVPAYRYRRMPVRFCRHRKRRQSVYR